MQDSSRNEFAVTGVHDSGPTSWPEIAEPSRHDPSPPETFPEVLDFWTAAEKCGSHTLTKTPSSPPPRAQVIVVVEGGNDINFLKVISGILHRDDSRLPDLELLDRQGTLVFIPAGGTSLREWTHRLQGLGLPEFHLYDSETPPLTAEREVAVAKVNSRPNCLAQLTRKRSAENYLHPAAIWEARGVDIEVTDDMDVPDSVARQTFESQTGVPWGKIPSRARRRLRNRAKLWLNSAAATRMSPQRIDERDPHGDVRGWLSAIAWLLGPRGKHTSP